MKRIDGTSLGTKYWSGSESARREAEALLYPLMAQLHALPANEVVPTDPLSTSRAPYGFVDREINTLRELISCLDGTETTPLRVALDWLSAHRDSAPCEQAVVIHRDFHPNNVLVTSDSSAFVIDWSNATVGDRRADLAWTRLILRSEDHPDRGDTSPRLYEQAANVVIERLGYFEAAACLRLILSTLISLRHGATRQGMRAGAVALMRQDDSLFRYAAALLQGRTGVVMADLEDALDAGFGFPGS
jgi:aminoglycoside phosphotransferase (APT) family kinase protein